jgi:hypothetical protein
VTVEKGAVLGEAQAGARGVRLELDRRERDRHFFDSQGHVTVDELVYDDGRWMCVGERIRTTAELSYDGSVQHALHERSDDGVGWRLAMDVTLRKID